MMKKLKIASLIIFGISLAVSLIFGLLKFEKVIVSGLSLRWMNRSLR